MKERLKKLISETDYRLSVFLIILVSFLFAIGILLLFLFKGPDINFNSQIDTTIFSDYGVLVGGITAALLALASVLLIVQTLNEQILRSELQNIETRFFELIKLHRDNVNEFESKGRTGKKVVIDIFDEFQSLYSKVQHQYFDSRRNEEIDDKNREIAVIAYYITFYGIDNNSFPELEMRIRNVMKYDDFYFDAFKPILLDKLIGEHKEIKYSNENLRRESRNYLPHDGHQSRLGHYFRHLYQSVNFINAQPSNRLSYPKKYSYVKTLRAQLSTHEQALLFINSLSSLGAAWELKKKDVNEKLITKYNLIKNLPHGFVGALKPEKYFPDLNFEFNEEKSESRKKLEKEYK
ncbi:MAG: putative phage abortive infection protein [Balneolaceae bacterium]